jgi:putative transposase
LPQAKIEWRLWRYAHLRCHLKKHERQRHDFTLAWGNDPGRLRAANSSSAESAIHIWRIGHHDARMPQSLSAVLLHIIFSTKNREPWLDRDLRPRIHAYLATICRDLGAEFVHAGGMADHVHIITTLPRTVSQAEMIEQIKKTSSKWIKNLDRRYRGFFWQRGYAAFSVSPSQFKAVLKYVDTQQQHHRTRTFQEEYRKLLRKHGVAFDERYVWD